MTNLDSILKNRDINFTDKTHIIKAMVFPVVMYGCESWTVKKAEPQRIDALELWCWRRLLRVLWTERRSSQSIINEISPEYFLKGLIMKLQYLATWWEELTHWQCPCAGKGWRQEEKGTTEVEMCLDGITNLMYEFEQAPGIGDRQGSTACCSSWGCKESDMTEQSNWSDRMEVGHGKELGWSWELDVDWTAGGLMGDIISDE